MERQLHDCLRDHPDVTVDFFPAINGQTLTPATLLERGADIDRTWVNPYNNQPLTHGEVGCALSHHAVWTRVRDGRWPDVLVLEDDVILPRDLLRMLEAGMAELDDPWDLAYIGRKPLRRGEHRLSEHTVVPRYSYWTNGYVLNKAGAEKLLATDFNQHIIPVDEYLPLLYHSHSDPKRIRHYARFSPLLAVAFDPVLIRPIDDTFQDSDTEHSPRF
jgi:collagen beta-1,O-galactosyltransferase